MEITILGKQLAGLLLNMIQNGKFGLGVLNAGYGATQLTEWLHLHELVLVRLDATHLFLASNYLVLVVNLGLALAGVEIPVNIFFYYPPRLVHPFHPLY